MTTVRALPREFRELPLDLIDEPTMPSRTEMSDAKLEELVADIRANGLLQPMIVARVGARYEVIAGHRRRVACGRAGLVVAPCLIYATKNDALDAVQFSENYQREELSAADEAIWFSDKLERQCNGDVDVLCARVGMKRSYVENRLLLFRGDPDVFRELQGGNIGIGVAHALNKCDDERQRRSFLDAVRRGGATAGLVERWVSDWKRDVGLAPPSTAPVVAADLPAPMPEDTYFVCACCGRRDNVHLMRPVNIHQHCKLAIFDPLMASFRGES